VGVLAYAELSTWVSDWEDPEGKEVEGS
jgi:hypothetical protein